MTNPEVAILMLSLFILMVLLGFPVAFTLLAMGIGFGYYAYYEAGSIEVISDVFSNKIFYLLNQNTYSVMENDTLVAIPLFLFMGYVADGTAGVSGDGQGSLRQEFRLRRHLRRRHTRHFDSAFHHADRLCGNRRTFASAPLRRRHYPGVPPGRIVRYLRHHSGHV
jgi:hypothetical protein